jgi:hypothetical protein
MKDLIRTTGKTEKLTESYHAASAPENVSAHVGGAAVW